MPLDVTIKPPRYLKGSVSKNSLERLNIFKNVVMDIIVEIRNEKRKPKLGDFLKMFNNINTSEEKDRIISKIKILYSGGSQAQKI